MTDTTTEQCPECGKSFERESVEDARNAVAGHAARAHGLGYQRIQAQFDAHDAVTDPEESSQDIPDDPDSPDPDASEDIPGSDGGPFSAPDPTDGSADVARCPGCDTPIDNAGTVAEAVAENVSVGASWSTSCPECGGPIVFEHVEPGSVAINE